MKLAEEAIRVSPPRTLLFSFFCSLKHLECKNVNKSVNNIVHFNMNDYMNVFIFTLKKFVFCKGERNSVGRVSASQAECRGFEPRRSLHSKLYNFDF